MKARLYTSERMAAIEAASVIDGDVDADGNLILTTYGGTAINAGNVRGPKGADAAPGSIDPLGNTTPIRTPNGQVRTAAPQVAADATTKQYVDAAAAALASLNYVDGLVKGTELPSSIDLNNYVSAGIFIQSQTAGATSGMNYPIGLAGLLEVSANVGGFVWQRYTPYGPYATEFYVRTKYNGIWYPWRRWSSDKYTVGGGIISVTPNASGQATIAHGLPYTPTWAVANTIGTSTYFATLASTPTSTGITIVVAHKTSTVMTSGSIGISWSAGR